MLSRFIVPLLPEKYNIKKKQKWQKAQSGSNFTFPRVTLSLGSAGHNGYPRGWITRCKSNERHSTEQWFSSVQQKLTIPLPHS
jgi:hypothetical protein